MTERTQMIRIRRDQLLRLRLAAAILGKRASHLLAEVIDRGLESLGDLPMPNPRPLQADRLAKVVKALPSVVKPRKSVIPFGLLRKSIEAGSPFVKTLPLVVKGAGDG